MRDRGGPKRNDALGKASLDLSLNRAGFPRIGGSMPSSNPLRGLPRRIPSFFDQGYRVDTEFSFSQANNYVAIVQLHPDILDYPRHESDQ